MKQLNVKKLVLLNLPYILLGLFATNLGEAWRLAVGADVSAKMLSFFSTLPVALGSWWPSLHPLDLAVGICCGAALRLAVYLKSKNAKKYRHNMEYGSARWGTHDDIAPYMDPVFQNMTDMESRLMDMDLGPLFGLWFQSLFIGITMWALYICIFIVIYGRMIEIYLVTSVAPIPMATMMGTGKPVAKRYAMLGVNGHAAENGRKLQRNG